MRPSAAADRSSDRLRNRDDPESLGPVGASGVIDNEARRVGGNDRMLVDALHEAGEHFHQRGVAPQAVDHLNKAHQRRRIEKMQSADTLRSFARGGYLRHGKRRCVGGKHGVMRQMPFQFAEQLSLCIDVLNDGFNDNVRVLCLVERMDRFDAIEHVALCVG